MSKKASGDQFSLSGGNSDSVGPWKTDFGSGKDFFWVALHILYSRLSLKVQNHYSEAPNPPNVFQMWRKKSVFALRNF